MNTSLEVKAVVNAVVAVHDGLEGHGTMEEEDRENLDVDHESLEEDGNLVGHDRKVEDHDDHHDGNDGEAILEDHHQHREPVLATQVGSAQGRIECKLLHQEQQHQ